MEKFNSNTIEPHPWMRFPKENNKAHSLIVGSFPPRKFTQRPPNLTKGDVDFFYGSEDNSFWDLFIGAKGLKMKWPDDEEKLKNWLIEHKWAISDIVFNAKRKKDSAGDTDLKHIQWNEKIIDDILINNPIGTIYFTSKWVNDQFCINVRKKLKNFNRNINEVILISPSRSGLISLDWAREILPQQNESNTDFRKRYYNKFLK